MLMTGGTKAKAPYLTNYDNFPLANAKLQANAVYNPGGVLSVPIVNGMVLGVPADPKLGVENNASNVPSVSITQIDRMASVLTGYVKLDRARAPDSVKTGQVYLATVIKTTNNWWAPDRFWAPSYELDQQAHDFFETSLRNSPGRTFSIGASQAAPY